MTSSAAYGIAPDVGEVRDGERCYVAHLPEGPPLILADTATLIWQAARQGGTLDAIAQRVAEQVGLPAGEVVADVGVFVDELVRHGVLVRHDP